jgi:hypothetical protein
MVVFANQPGMTCSAIKARDLFTANERDGTVFAAKTILADTLVISNIF